MLLKAVQTRHLVHYTLSQKRNLIGRYSDGLKQEAAAFNDYTYGVSIGGCDCKKQIILFFKC
jgi:hypothetical protein